MLKLQHAVIISVLFCALLYISCDRPPRKYYRLVSRWLKEANAMHPADMNGDGVDEIVMESDGQLDVVDQTIRHHFKSFRMTDYLSFTTSPLTGTSLASTTFFVEAERADSNFVDLFTHISCDTAETRQTSRLFQFAIPQIANASHFLQMISFLGLSKARGESYAYFLLNTGRSLVYDRGILVYDLNTKKERWRYTCAPQLRTPCYLNLDDDDANEIIFGSYAPDNGIIRNGSRDDSSYVFCLDDDGALLWRKPFGGQFTGAIAYPGRFRPQGSQIAIITLNISDSNPNISGVYILDAVDGSLIQGPRFYGEQIPENTNFKFSPVADLNQDGFDEIVIGNSDGYARILNKDLAMINISKDYGKEIQIQAVVDMNGDGFFEIAAVIPDDRIVILDHNLAEMASYPILSVERVSLTPVKNGQSARLLYKTPYDFSTKKASVWRLLELQQSYIPFETYTGAAKYFWWAIGGIFTIGVFAIALFSRKRLLTRIFIKLLIEADLFEQTMLLTRKGKILTAGDHWQDLAGQPSDALVSELVFRIQGLPESLLARLQNALQKKKSSEFRLILQKMKRKMPILVKVEFLRFLSLYRTTLHYSSQEAFTRNIKVWASVAQKLAHGIKNPLTSMKLNLDELESHLLEQGAEDVIHEHVKSISDQIDRLRRMSDGFTRFIEFEEPELTATDINDFIKNVVAQIRDDIPKNIHITLDLNDALPPAFVNAEQLQYAFENVVFNAVQSITDHGTVIIQTIFLRQLHESISEPNEFVEIRIQDNGCGIDADLLDRVTDPYFTTKSEGTGLGLNIVVKIMKMHEGQFEIQSQAGVGTLVILRLKAVT